MNILYVFAHPQNASFNAMLKQQALDYLTNLDIPFKLSDLYADDFRAVADWDDFKLEKKVLSNQYFIAQQEAYNQGKLTHNIISEIEKIKWADHIIFQFPLWWFSVPAILKGWFDRVLVKGFAYDAGKIFDDGLLKGKSASLVLSTQSPESAYQIAGAHKATIDSFLHHIHHTLRFVGIKPVNPFVIYEAYNLDSKLEKQIIHNYFSYLNTLIENAA